MRRILSATIASVLILIAFTSPAPAQQPSVAELVVNRYLATGAASERDLLLLMSQPREFLRYQQALKAAAPGLEQQALAIRRTVFQRALARLTAGEGGGTVQAVIALGSWATELNAGDMDIVVRGGREAAKRLNQLLHEEIEKILQQEGDDVCRAVFSKGARFTVETFEIFVSTLEDFGYDSLRTAFGEALEIAAREGQAAGAAHLNRAADSIIRRNLNAQRFAAVQKEYYPGASGQDFVRDYFAKQGKSRTWRVGDNGALDASWDAGLTADQLTETLIRDLGLSVDSMSHAFKFPVIADELLQWGERSKLGAREQAKGLVRAYEARPGGSFGLLTEEEKRVLKAARILAKTPRENQAYIRQVLQAEKFATEQAFSKAGEEMLWNLTKASNNEAMRVIVENQKAAVEAAKAGKQVEAQYRRIKDYLMSNEQLAGYSKLKPEQLLKLADELPADMAFREEMAALLEFMAEGSDKGARSAAAMAKRLVKLAYQQKRLSAEATEEAIKAIRAGKGVPADVEDVIAVLRKDLADAASIRAVSPATDSLADCLRTSSLFSKGQLILTPELEAMIEEISRLSNIELLQLGFKNSEIALLRELNAARAQGARLSAIGEALKKTAPKNYRTILKGFVEEAKKAAPSSLAFQGAFALWGVYRVALDPSIPEEEQRKRLGEAIYTAFPTAGLVLDGLPMAYIQYTEGGEVDAKGLGEGVAFAGLEILGLVHPVWAGALLAGYATYQVSSFVLQAEEDRQFVTALYRALDGNTLKVRGGTRSFDTSGVKVSVDPTTKLPHILHSAAFQDLYTTRGDALLDTGEGRKPYDRKVNVAIRDFAKRYVWDTNEDLKIMAAAVKKYFPAIDLDRVESWNLGELTEQAATVEKNEFRVGAHLVRRYINHRDLLTESALRHIRGRLFEMQTALKTVEASKKELEAVEKSLDMEKKIVPNAQAEQDSFTGWLWDAATSSVTRLEQISGIWKRYLKTYKEALAVHGRVTKIFESADLPPPTAADLFGLSGVESTDRPKIDAVYQSFQTAFDKAYQEYRGAKGGNPDPKDPFDADAWKRLLSLRMRLFLGEFQKTTPARLAALEKEVGQVLEEVREHYRGTVVLAVTGPTEAETASEVSLRVSATKAGKPADDALKNARVEWSIGQAVQNSGITWRFSPLEETVMNITVTATTELAGKRVVLGSATHRLTVKKPKDDKKDDKKDDGKDGVVPPVVPGKWKFSGTSPGNWTAGYNEKGLVMERKPAKNKFPCGESSVTAKLWAEFPVAASGKDDPKSAADCLAAAEKSFKARRQGNTPNDMAVGLFMAGGVEGANGFSLGDFQGAMADFALWMRRGSGSPWSGYTGSYFGANGSGSAVKGNMLLRFGYGVWGGGCWDNSDRAYLVTQGVAAQEEARAILASLRAGPDGEIKQEPYKGPKYDGSDLPKVTLSPPKLEKLRVGDTVQVTAEVHNDKPEDSPFTYNWGGTFDGKPEDSKKKATITIKPQKPGKYDLSVSVDGKRFGMGGASLQYEVADYRVKIERAPADTKPVPVGVKTGLKATLTVDGKPASGTFIYRWQPHPEVTFDKLDSSAPDVQAAFPKPGRVKVWVQVLEKREGREATVAESDQLEIEVIKPQLELAFTPKEPYVGQEVKAKLTVKPEVKDIDFRWMPVPGNVKQSMESKDGREITFTLKDDKPAEIHVLARVPKSGEDLGEAKGTVKAKKYAVNVSGPKAMGPKPKMWKEGVGLVDVENAIAVDQIVEFAADVQPQPQAGPVQYEWRVKSGPCRVSNPIVREARVTAGEAGTCELSVVARDRNDVELGIGAGSFSATVTRDAIQKGQQKAKDAADAKAKVQSAKDKARKGDYDGAIRDAEEAAKLDPANKEATDTARKLRQEKETIHQQLGKAKKLMDENKFADAQKELIVASNINSYYPAVQQANQELGTRWNKYNGEVRDRVYEVRSANERKDFGKALEIAAAWRASTKLDAYADKELKQQEDWARQWKAQKDRQTGILKAAGEKVRAYDYAGALKQYDEGFANGQNIYNGTEPEYKEAVELRSQAFTKNKRLQELIPWVRKAAEDKEYLTVDALQNTLKTADEAIALQPNNEQLKQWRAMIVARAEKTKADNERIAQGRKYLDAAGNAERSYLTNESSIQARQLQWGEKLEEQQQLYLTTAIQNYRASLQYIPDASVEKKIKELETTLGGRKTYLENYRLSITLKNEADALVQQATKDPDIQTAAPLYDQAIAKYRKSLSLYRPFNAESIERQIWNLETGKHDRWVRKYWADGQSLEKEAKYVAALAAYDKAITSFHPTVEQKDRMWIIVHAQELRNRIAGAKNWRADGEAKQNAGKIPEAIASYRQSLKLLPDPALEEHVRVLEGKQAEAGQKKAAADRLWQEGTALFNQGRPSEALTKFKESAGLWPDTARQKYVADLEARRAKAAALREEGSKLQNQNRVPQAIAKYRESLTHWPDPQLDKHIRQLEAIIATAPTAPTGTSTSPAGPSSTAPADTGFYLVDLTPYGGKKGAPRKVKNIEVDDGSWIRLKATHEKRLRLDIPLPQRVAASAVAVVSNLDNAHNVPDKMTTTVLTVQTTSGDRVFEIKAGVHSSEWNRGETGGATHAWPKETNIGGSRWMAVFSLPAGSVVTGLRFDHRDTDKKYYHGDAAPGFCLRGITLVGSPVGTASAGTAATSTGSWTGAWRSDPGPDGEVVTFDLSQSGSRITGTFRVDVPYTAASGARQKETIRGTLEGTVSGGRVTGTFRESSDTKPAGSFEFTMAQSGNLFTALVRGEDTSDTYTVRRSGSAASSGGSVSSGQTVSRSVAAEITNRSRDYAHVFTDGETFGPGNRLAPGEKRRVAVTMKPDGSVTFKAGRNGQVLATKTWRGIAGDTSRVPVVVFDDTNPFDKLTVTTGLR